MTNQIPELIWKRPQQLAAVEDTATNTSEPKTAILICHGMGKQLRFEALNDVAKLLSKEMKLRNGSLPVIRNRHVKFENSWAPRVELDIPDPSGKIREVHLYETYWAPLTEGKVTARDVTRFLFTAAWKGVRNSLSDRFDRWMFGGLQRFRYPVTTLFGILGAFLLICVIWGVFAILMASATRFFTHLYQSFASETGISFSEPFSKLYDHLNIYTILWLIALLLLWGLRTLYIQYVGDVAAYVSSHDVSKFNDTRQAIQETVCKVARAIYQARKPSGQHLYDRVIIVAHSLGSLVIYDALNMLINEETVDEKQITIPDRTKLFLTFGSPLDKIAFLFRTQKKSAEVREVLAAGKQPMIVDYDFRPLKWINLYSPMDPVSGKLNFYDTANQTTNPKRIENRRDLRAWIPGWAHNQYWKNPLLRRTLFDAL